MVEITKIDSSTIELRGISIADGEKVKTIMDICHEYKHLYMEGYPCGRKTRLKNKKRIKKWAECPKICFTYLVTNDTKNHNLAIKILVSDTQNLKKIYSDREIEYYMQMYTQDVADRIIANKTINDCL